MKIVIFATLSILTVASAEEMPQIQGWKLVSDTTLPSLDQKFSEQGWESAHFCTYKVLDAPESSSKMVLVIPGGCIPFFGIAGFKK